MLVLASVRVVRQICIRTANAAKVSNLLEKANHPKIHHAYYGIAIVVYLAHITVSLQHGFEVEGTITAAAAALELIAHVAGE
jgi:hypothetical protein